MAVFHHYWQEDAEPFGRPGSDFSTSTQIRILSYQSWPPGLIASVFLRMLNRENDMSRHTC